MEYTCDLAILGAGTAGSAAAIAARDSGLSVLLVEQFGAAGGSGTLGLVTPIMNTFIPGNPMCSYVSSEINRRMVEIGAAAGRGDSWFDPMMLEVVLEQMLAERGVKILYHTFLTGVSMEGRRVSGVEVHNKSGKSTVRAKWYLDATGDADLCALAGLPTLHGSEEDGKNQPVSLRYALGGVDLDAYWRFYQQAKTPEGDIAPRPENFDGAVTGDKGALAPVFRRAISAGDLTEEDALYWQFFTIPGRSDALAFNCPEFFDIHNAENAENQTFVQTQGKLAILRQLRFYKKYVPGFSGAYISAISQMVGVRESRRAVTDHVITAEECVSRERFPDAICRSNYPMDIHGRTLKCFQPIPKKENAAPYYEIPLRCLIVKDADNLMVAGRNLGAEFAAHSSIRVIPTCRAMGEACAIAAAEAENRALPTLHDVDGARVREEMRRRGADFGRD